MVTGLGSVVQRKFIRPWQRIEPATWRALYYCANQPSVVLEEPWWMSQPISQSVVFGFYKYKFNCREVTITSLGPEPRELPTKIDDRLTSRWHPFYLNCGQQYPSSSIRSWNNYRHWKVSGGIFKIWWLQNIPKMSEDGTFGLFSKSPTI